jgi:hypothetical protein
LTETGPEPRALLAELEAAFAAFEEARVRLHGACAAAAKGLLAMGERVERAERELSRTQGEVVKERDAALLHVAALEGEVAALREAHDKASTESVETSARALDASKRLGELEGTVAALTEAIAKATLERDAHGQHAVALETALVETRSELAKRPGLDYLTVLEGEKAHLAEELGRMRVELERVKLEIAEMRTKKITTSSARIRAAAPPPPVPEAKAFQDAPAKAAEKPKPPGALDVDALLKRAKSVKKPGA